jgi:hypothetical protein
MTVERLRELFDADNDSAEAVAAAAAASRRPTWRNDLNALILLDRLLPETDDIIDAADHDIIYLGVDLDALAAVASEDDILALNHFGVYVNGENDSLAMFV